MRLFTKKLLWWLPTVIIIAAIIILSTRQIPALNGRHLDKVLHFIVYGIVAVLSYLSFSQSGFKKPILWAIGLTVLVGILDESLQATSRWRSPSAYDFIADVIGAVAGALAAARLHSVARPGPEP